jgi:hypothetical protein
MTGRERLGGKRLICTLLACGVLLSVALAPVAGAHQDRFTNLNWQQNLAIPWQFTGEVPNWAFAAISNSMRLAVLNSPPIPAIAQPIRDLTITTEFIGGLTFRTRTGSRTRSPALFPKPTGSGL